MSELLKVLDIEKIEEDLYRGMPTRTHLTRTFGGQVAGQSLVAATRTMAAELAVHSLHGYFLRPGNPLAPTVYSVDRVRDGRSFATRRVTAVQNGKAIFTMAASFQVAEEGPEHQDLMPDAPDPDSLVNAEGDLWRQIHEVEWPEFDIRRVPDDSPGSHQQVWIRHRERLADDPVLHACALAYISDMTLLGSTRKPHPEEQLQMASLDHAVWFLRPFRTDDWLLYDQVTPSAGGGRALAQGRIFDRSGRLVANVVQEGLMRFQPAVPS